MSADYAVSFFYFSTSFICLFALLKKYSKKVTDVSLDVTSMTESDQFVANALSPRELVKLILGRWFRLAFPVYLVLLFAATLFNYVGSGPMYLTAAELNLEQ